MATYLASWRKSKEGRVDGGVRAKLKVGDEFKETEGPILQSFINCYKDLGFCSEWEWESLKSSDYMLWFILFKGHLAAGREETAVGQQGKQGGYYFRKSLTLWLISANTFLASYYFPGTGSLLKRGWLARARNCFGLISFPHQVSTSLQTCIHVATLIFFFFILCPLLEKNGHQIFYPDLIKKSLNIINCCKKSAQLC